MLLATMTSIINANNVHFMGRKVTKKRETTDLYLKMYPLEFIENNFYYPSELCIEI